MNNFALLITYLGLSFDFQHIDTKKISKQRSKHYFLLKLLHIIIYRSESYPYVNDNELDSILDQKYHLEFDRFYHNNKNLSKIIFEDRILDKTDIVCKHNVKYQTQTKYLYKFIFYNYCTDESIDVETCPVSVV